MTFTQRTKRLLSSPDRCEHEMISQTRIAGLSRSICDRCGQITLANMSDQAAARRRARETGGS